MNDMLHFCTYFDSNYLNRGLVLYDSLERHTDSFQLHILCLDEECYATLSSLNLHHASLIRLTDLESWDRELQEAKASRSRIEYYFTLTPNLPLFVFHRHKHVRLLTYLDADMMFFHKPSAVFDEIGDASIAITPHRYPPHLRHLEKYGHFNVGWLTFRRDTNALSCLQRWRDQCLEWCKDELDGNRFADQKYLDDWPSTYDGVHIIEHKGVNLAPWNIGQYKIEQRQDSLYVDELPVVVYHFHGLKHWFGPIFDTGLGLNRIKLTRKIRNGIYRPYLDRLLQQESKSQGASVVSRANLLHGLQRIITQSSNKMLRIKQLLIFLYSLLIARSYIIYRHS